MSLLDTPLLVSEESQLSLKIGGFYIEMAILIRSLRSKYLDFTFEDLDKFTCRAPLK